MERKEIVSSIKKYISKGQTEKAIELLVEYSEEIECSSHDEAILLSGQYTQWKRESLMGIQQSSSDLRRIDMAILDIIDKRLGNPKAKEPVPKKVIPQEPTPAPAPKTNTPVDNTKKEKNKLIPILVGVISVLLIGLSITLVLNNQKTGDTADKTAKLENVLEAQGDKEAATVEISSAQKETANLSEQEQSTLSSAELVENPSQKGIANPANEEPPPPALKTPAAVEPSPVSTSPKKTPSGGTSKTTTTKLKILNKGQTLRDGEKLFSPNGSYYLLMQEDCNLMVYDKEGRPIWATMTQGNGRGGKLVMQVDGNLVVYNKNNKQLWSSKTHPDFDSKFSSADMKPVKLVLENDGRLALYTSANKAVWYSDKFQ
ncbi:MAG: hypothetical protein DHS20C18_48540 [Saprospiraceae bacterium]|nr:MAG: hypothetical protein DHS20C18_48540 [Saprospiraceae bacterium]